MDREVTAKILLHRQDWNHGPRRPSAKMPQRRMSVSAACEMTKETLEGTAKQLKQLDPVLSDIKEEVNGLSRRRQSMPGGIKLYHSKSFTNKRQDNHTIVEDSEQDNAKPKLVSKKSK